MKHFYSVPLLLLAIIGCRPSVGSAEANVLDNPDLRAALPGVWEAVSFRVVLNAADSSASQSVFEVAPGEWQAKLGIAPVLTHYDTASRFRQEYQNNPSGSSAPLTRGIWNIFGDTLMMITPEATYVYRVQLNGQEAVFRCLLDWDNDGQEDDEYTGIQKRVKQP